MSRLDIFYRAFTDYRKITREARECSRARKMLARAGADGDKIEVIQNVCHIDDDWIEAIEEGLVHIGKAIEEDRQFIRSNGEVVPIEKVKNVSRESVEHLAKHSNLITRITEGEDITPDQLFTVERLSDYAVYENRFLYMLLCYLRDFITFRYEKITELANTYSGSLVMNKYAEFDGRKISYEVKLDEVIADDPFLGENNPAREKIGRINDILRGVLLYLSTPLMESVSKSPKLKPPITETNVLKMNKNFRGAVRLYYFITAYEKDGFSIERITKTLAPFTEEIADEVAESIELGSFLAYEYGMGIGGVLRERYMQEEARRKQLEEERRAEQFEKLRKRVRENGGDAEEYMLMLEGRLRSLENDSAQLKVARAEAERLGAKIEQLTADMSALAEKVEEGRRLLTESEAAHKSEIERLDKEHAEEVKRLGEEREREIAQLKEEQSQAMAAAREEFAKEREGYERKLKQAADDGLEKSRRLASALQDYEKLKAENTLISAKYNAVRRQQGLTSADDFSSQESFGEIERQYEAFRLFFKEQWKKAKKRIRRDVFAEVKAKNGKKDKNTEGGITFVHGAPQAPADSAKSAPADTDKDKYAEGAATDGAEGAENNPAGGNPQNKDGLL